MKRPQHRVAERFAASGDQAPMKTRMFSAMTPMRPPNEVTHHVRGTVNELLCRGSGFVGLAQDRVEQQYQRRLT